MFNIFQDKKYVYFLSFLAIAVVAYYAVNYSRITSERVSECGSLGRQHAERLQSEQGSTSVILETLYRYDAERNACIFYLSKVDMCAGDKSVPCRYYDGIRNLYTNQIIDEFAHRPGEEFSSDIVKQQVDFIALKNKLFR